MRSHIDRFMAKVSPEPTSGCWLWTGTLHGSPGARYGAFRIDNRWVKAHRAAVLLLRGTDPGRLCVLHRCDNPPCVNPDHLFLGTPGDNARDRARKGRGGNRHGEKNGRAKVTAADVREIRRLYARGWVRAELARHYGLSWNSIDFIVKGRNWRGASQ